MMILGDLNAGCGYVTIKGWKSVRLRNDPKFSWLIGDDQDTTVREKTHCAYDRSTRTTHLCFRCLIFSKCLVSERTWSSPHRIIVHGQEIVSNVVPGSAQPFNFKETFHLTEAEVNQDKEVTNREGVEQ